MKTVLGFVVLCVALVIARPSLAELKAGDPAPLFTAKTQDGEVFDLASRTGQWTVLYFYPKAGTPGCTKQACAFRDGIKTIRAEGAEVYGISADTVDAQAAFHGEHHLGFTLLADPDGTVINAYGAKTPLVTMAKRWTFIIGPDLTIRQVERDVDPALDAQRVATEIAKLKSGAPVPARATPASASPAAADPPREVATLAGGCFWGMEEILRQIPGVTSTRVGYTGGTTAHPTYPDVHAGTTGHAEAVEVVFDPSRISYEDVLGYFFRMHDPTTLNRQGNDVGTSYRSVIFYHSDAQRQTAERVKSRVDQSGKWPAPIVTEIVAAGEFWPAEDEHQRYLQKHPGGYTCHYLRD